jgi:hypothetical protein
VDGWETASGPITHYSLAGSFSQSEGTLSNSWFDANDGGSLDSFTPGGPPDNFGTIQPIAPLDGVASATMQVPGPSLDNATVFIYVINPSELLVVSFDLPGEGAIFEGEAIATSAWFTAASVEPSYIFASTGTSAGVATSSIGIVGFSSGSSSTVSGKMYTYAVGTPGTQNLTGSYAFTAASGRLAITGASEGTSPVCYLTNPVDGVSAFCISTDPTASLGMMDVQPAVPYSNSSLSGNFFFGSAEPGDDTAPDLSGVASISSGNLTGTEDTSSSSGLSLGAAINAALSIHADGTGTLGPNTILVTNGTEIYFINEANGAPAQVQEFQP